MPAAPAAHEDRRRRRRALLLLLLFASALPSLISTAISISLFIDIAALDSYAYAATPVDVAAEPALLLTAAHLLPGDVVDGEFVVRNAGTSPLRYAVEVSATDTDGRGLRDALDIRIWKAGADCSAAAGVPFYVGRLSNARVGDSTPGAQPGDRRLDVAEAETLCVRMTLPLGTANRYQAAETAVSFNLSAESEDVAE